MEFITFNLQASTEIPVIILAWKPDDYIRLVTVIFSGVTAILSASALIVSSLNFKRGQKNTAQLATLNTQTNHMSDKLQTLQHAAGVTQGENNATAAELAARDIPK